MITMRKFAGRDEGGRRVLRAEMYCWQRPQRKLRMKMSRTRGGCDVRVYGAVAVLLVLVLPVSAEEVDFNVVGVDGVDSCERFGDVGKDVGGCCVGDGLFKIAERVVFFPVESKRGCDSAVWRDLIEGRESEVVEDGIVATQQNAVVADPWTCMWCALCRGTAQSFIRLVNRSFPNLSSNSSTS